VKRIFRVISVVVLALVTSGVLLPFTAIAGDSGYHVKYGGGSLSDLKAGSDVQLASVTVLSGMQAQTSRHRIGATCKDGTNSTATGSGACSHHGGVSCWQYSDGTCTKP
jgi:uncharacterized Ntn-hydrolase superfamily protein